MSGDNDEEEGENLIRSEQDPSHKQERMLKMDGSETEEQKKE